MADIEFDDAIRDEARNAWAQTLNTDPNQGHGKYELLDFGVTEEMAREAVGAYYQRFLEIDRRASADRNASSGSNI